jgi:hypothetical protein
MVAYSFKKRFAAPIRSGDKAQTIRGERKRHARIGEPIQLYTGMRTRQCERICDDPVCVGVRPIMIQWSEKGLECVSILPDQYDPNVSWAFHPWGDHALDPSMHDSFAIADGFDDQSDMAAFWTDQCGLVNREYIGVLIEWRAAS